MADYLSDADFVGSNFIFTERDVQKKCDASGTGSNEHALEKRAGAI